MRSRPKPISEETETECIKLAGIVASFTVWFLIGLTLASIGLVANWPDKELGFLPVLMFLAVLPLALSGGYFLWMRRFAGFIIRVGAMLVEMMSWLRFLGSFWRIFD
ncbi:hypothetical protein [Aestuariispira insulae]|uniref:Uncharacterized protein n=1 Tax=Aestuariispira insulae TaxID=1461337 RepID=A0A3D9HST5_9PROT|nr:hypothetical protein [Aestuariispira insulae]RED52411.1 hypothetical protein DFP90_102432 [Aestuariispira insulae]